MTVLLDTGILYAYYDRRDDWHDAARHLIESEVRGLVIPAPVLPEVDYLLNKRLGIDAQAVFYRGLASKDFIIV
jgi:predicted nucleic acid-binding protein